MKVSVMECLVLVTAMFLVILGITDGQVCFKKYNAKKGGCHHPMHRFMATAEDCCSSGGQGYSTEKRQTGRRKWFSCVPCSLDIKVQEDTINNEVTKKKGNRDTEKVKGKPIILKTKENDDKESYHPICMCKADQVDWTEWSDWGPCTVSCDSGVQHRGRFCLSDKCEGDDLQEQPCPDPVPCPVDGGWDDWGDWSVCSVTCGTGEQVRSRGCHNPVPRYGGKPCEGISEQSQNCDLPPCQIDGDWSDWSDWNECNVTCGQGYQERTRRCDNPPPSNGGLQCEGEFSDIRSCHADVECAVDGGWCEWGDWSPCLFNGIQTSFRSCDCPTPRFSGTSCTGRNVRRRGCTPEATSASAETDSGSASGGGCGGEGSGDGSDPNCDQEDDYDEVLEDTAEQGSSDEVTFTIP